MVKNVRSTLPGKSRSCIYRKDVIFLRIIKIVDFFFFFFRCYCRGLSKIVFHTPLRHMYNKKKTKFGHWSFRLGIVGYISRRSNPFDRWTMLNIDEGYRNNIISSRLSPYPTGHAVRFGTRCEHHWTQPVYAHIT